MAKSATLTIDSTKIDPAAMWEIENIIYGSPEAPPRMPLPREVISVIKQEGLVEDPNDPGTFLIMYGRWLRTRKIREPTTLLKWA
jgi:hypothetical protein